MLKAGEEVFLKENPKVKVWRFEMRGGDGVRPKGDTKKNAEIKVRQKLKFRFKKKKKKKLT